MPKMHQNTFGDGLRPDPLGELMRSPRPFSRNGGLLLRRTKGMEGRKERTERDRIPPKVKVSRIYTDEQ